MEVGAVKQAFNNEIIQLKKSLNQAKVQIIHKLTRKAKTLAEKKAPEQLKEKLKRKAELAVNEVLTIKKIKSRDIAKFSITHTGQLKDYLNKPKVDNDKACARLLLHKALQDKYKFIRSRFAGVPIKDLFMSRQERRKIKKEARDSKKNKNKKKDKSQVVNSEGDWNVEDVKADDKQISNGEIEVAGSDADNDSAVDNSGDENSGEENSGDENSDDENSGDDNNDNDEEMEEGSDIVVDNNDNADPTDDENNSESEENEEEMQTVGKFVKTPPKSKPEVPFVPQIKMSVPKAVKNNTNKEIKKEKKIKLKDKNKNFNQKILQRNFKKDTEETTMSAQKVADPFFITSSGENYMSLAEPRLPDEIKDEHKQGNRKLRRAVMFGHVPNIKPKQNNYRQDDQRQDNRFNNQNGFEKGNRGNRFNDNHDRGSKFNKRGSNFNDRGSKFNDKRSNFNDTGSNFNNRGSKFNDNGSKFNDKGAKFNDKGSNFNDRGSRFNDKGSKFNDRNKINDVDAKPEKLHPSWEAKKRQSGILPFKGKKIVFDES